MPPIDGNISNGTCYISEGVEADKSFIPCGNNALGHVSCCRANDVCLRSNTCFTGQWYTTYMVGCTDPSYEDESCPNKTTPDPFYNDSPWVGLANKPPEHTKSNVESQWTWVPCPQSDKPSTLKSAQQGCTPADWATISVIAFMEDAVLPGVAQLPISKSGTLHWSNGFGPSQQPMTSVPYSFTMPTSLTMDADTSSTSTSSISRGSSSGGSKSGASGSATSSSGTSSSGTSSSSSSIDTSTITAAPSISTSSPASSETAILPKNNNSSIGVGAKVGISLGAIFGAFLILGALSALWLVYRRKKGENGQRSADMGATAAGNNGPDGEFKPPALPEMPNSPATPDTPAFGELSNEHTARPWSMRSELPSHQGATSPSLSQISPQLPFVPPPTVDEEDPYYQAQPQPPKRVSSYPGQPQYRPYRASTQYDAMSPSSFELPG